MERDAAAAAMLVGAGLAVLTLTSGAAIHRAAGDVGSIAFAATSYATQLARPRCSFSLPLPSRLRDCGRRGKPERGQLSSARCGVFAPS
uniref:Uncharacterized protein n=1 Tax=Oryza punctata TaxID=4537 RepID=A0A0E0L7R6_ORYPU